MRKIIAAVAAIVVLMGAASAEKVTIDVTTPILYSNGDYTGHVAKKGTHLYGYQKGEWFYSDDGALKVCAGALRGEPEQITETRYMARDGYGYTLEGYAFEIKKGTKLVGYSDGRAFINNDNGCYVMLSDTTSKKPQTQKKDEKTEKSEKNEKSKKSEKQGKTEKTKKTEKEESAKNKKKNAMRGG